MTESAAHKCLSQLAVERYLHDELESAECARIEEAMELCELCRAKVEQTRAAEEAFRLRPVPGGIRELWTKPPPRPGWKLFAVAVPVAAGAVLVLALAFFSGDRSPPGEYVAPFDQKARSFRTRIMGLDPATRRDAAEPKQTPIPQLNLGFYVLADDEEVKGQPGQHLRGGDRIQFWYDAPSDGAAVIVGIDGRNQVTRYFPAGPASSGKIQQGRGHLIASSVILDDAPGIERFYLCFGEAAEDPAAVEKAAQTLASTEDGTADAPGLLLDCAQASVWITKDR